jgi:hypothetical protein
MKYFKVVILLLCVFIMIIFCIVQNSFLFYEPKAVQEREQEVAYYSEPIPTLTKKEKVLPVNIYPISDIQVLADYYDACVEYTGHDVNINCEVISENTLKVTNGTLTLNVELTSPTVITTNLVLVSSMLSTEESLNSALSTAGILTLPIFMSGMVESTPGSSEVKPMIEELRSDVKLLYQESFHTMLTTNKGEVITSTEMKYDISKQINNITYDTMKIMLNDSEVIVYSIFSYSS